MTDPTASFLVVLPPGWARFPALEQDRAELGRMAREVIDRSMPADLPRDRTEPVRQEMQKRLIASVIAAGDDGASAVWLPVQPVDGFTPPLSVIEAEVDDESEEAPEQVIAQLLAEALPTRTDPDDPGIREVDGGIAARTVTVVRKADVAGELPDVAAGLPVVDDHQVVYSIPVPHRPGRWVVLSCSVLSRTDIADPVAAETTARMTDALIALFDAIMTTFRWTDVPGADPTTLEQRITEIAEARG